MGISSEILKGLENGTLIIVPAVRKDIWVNEYGDDPSTWCAHPTEAAALDNYSDNATRIAVHYQEVGFNMCSDFVKGL